MTLLESAGRLHYMAWNFTPLIRGWRAVGDILQAHQILFYVIPGAGSLLGVLWGVLGSMSPILILLLALVAGGISFLLLLLGFGVAAPKSETASAKAGAPASPTLEVQAMAASSSSSPASPLTTGLSNLPVAPNSAPVGGEPRFSVEFSAQRDIHRNVDLFDAATRKHLPIKATYVLLRVTSREGAVTTNCHGAITRLQRLDAAGKTIIEEQATRILIWAPRELGKEYQIIKPNLPQDLDIFCSAQSVNRLQLLSIAHPYSWDVFFDNPGVYRISISISGEGGTKLVGLRVTWRGAWDDFNVEME